MKPINQISHKNIFFVRNLQIHFNRERSEGGLYPTEGWSTCHDERSHAVHPALHGSFHQSAEPVTVPLFDVKPREVVQQVVSDRAVA